MAKITMTIEADEEKVVVKANIRGNDTEWGWRKSTPSDKIHPALYGTGTHIDDMKFLTDEEAEKMEDIFREIGDLIDICESIDDNDVVDGWNCRRFGDEVEEQEIEIEMLEEDE